MDRRRLSILLPDEAATGQFARDLAIMCRAGDILALRGPLGSGKTTLARAFIRHFAGDESLDVPSPSFTICQEYETQPPILHYDFYRLQNAAEAMELDFEERSDSAILLIEWPDVIVELLPRETLHLVFADEGDGRRLEISWHETSPGSTGERLARSLQIRAFLDRTWKPGAQRRHLQGDASSRRFETAELDGQVRIVMDFPRKRAEAAIRDGKTYSELARLSPGVAAFEAIDRLLRKSGFAAPAIHACDRDSRLVLVEHLGTEGIVDRDGMPIAERYCEAARILALVHSCEYENPVPLPGSDTSFHRIPVFDRDAILAEVRLFLDWYVPFMTGEAAGPGTIGGFLELWADLADRMVQARRSLVLRDYHSPNLIWRPGRDFPKNLGLIDFQDALIGPAAYDVASLVQDARTDIDADLQARIRDAYLGTLADTNRIEKSDFECEFAVAGSQRATKILGIFVRLAQRDGKDGYLRHLPRIRTYFRQNLEHPALASLRAWCEESGFHELTQTAARFDGESAARNGTDP